ncbi:hypothetical protein KEM56_002396, partial [Ascosphaera pollenicola]
EASKRPKRADPFENPSEDLFITDVPLSSPQHYLILNKFPIIPEHFILATKQYKPQTHYLEKLDLEATYAVLKAYEQEKSRLFAFFNSGDSSGASQPHRHVQFLPVANMAPQNTTGWEPLIDDLGTPGSNGVPFCWFSADLPRENLTGEDLHEIYLSLLQKAIGRVKTASADQTAPAADDAVSSRGEGEVEISYNLAMTTSRMVVCPRMKEGWQIPLSSGDVGEAKLNGTLLAGTVLVKERPEFDAIVSNPDILEDILSNIGYPKL